MEKRFVSWSEFAVFAEQLASNIKKAGKKYDLVIGIIRGGVPAALLIANRLKVKIDFVNIKSYTGYIHSEPQILSTLNEPVENRRILVVDDIVDSGDTLKTVTEWLKLQQPRTIETATLFKKPWCTVIPDYYSETVTEWIIFPWEDEGDPAQDFRSR